MGSRVHPSRRPPRASPVRRRAMHDPHRKETLRVGVDERERRVGTVDPQRCGVQVSRFQLDAGQAFVLARCAIPIVQAVTVVALFPHFAPIGSGEDTRVAVGGIPCAAPSSRDEDRSVLEETDRGEGARSLVGRGGLAVVDKACGKDSHDFPVEVRLCF